MPTFKLIPHPDNAPPANIAVEVDVDRVGGAMNLIFWLSGPDEAVRMPVSAGRKRIDGLWQHTCFEAFVRVDGHTSYSELNFSPRGDWASYTFDSYRAGMCELIGSAEPFIQAGYRGPRENDDYGWSYSTADAFDPSADWHLALSAVIEAKDGTKSYWALAHSPGPPDFHNPACFIATLPAPAAP